MKREFLQNFKVNDQPLTKEIIDAIMAENGRDIEAAKKPFADYDSIKDQLQTAKDIQRYNGGEDTTAYNPDDKKPVGEDGQLLNLEGGVTLFQVADAIKASCEYYSIPCLDLCRESGFNRLNFSYAVTNFTDDGLHPNAAGDERLAIMIADKIRAIAG